MSASIKVDGPYRAEKLDGVHWEVIEVLNDGKKESLRPRKIYDETDKGRGSAYRQMLRMNRKWQQAQQEGEKSNGNDTTHH